MGRVMPCRELLGGDSWLSESTVEGMRQGDRLEVLVARRRALCWVGMLEVEAVDVLGLALPLALLSPSRLADTLRGVLLCWGDAPRDVPPVAPPAAAEERKVCGEPWGTEVSLWEEERGERCCWERLESPFNRGGTS